ncbi:MAG: VCBS domain-containing protein, partial [Planctomycetota bacterium]|nr:VCBS domain-containing protein [Planctomycetota bacterium]
MQSRPTAPTASQLIYGQTLASSTLSGGVASVPGTFAFENATIAPTSGSSTYNVIFTPTDTANYTTMLLSVSVLTQAFEVVADTDIAGEAGGIANAIPGFNAVGNVIINDANYENKTLVVNGVGAGTVGQPLAGTYGTLTLLDNGDYVYVVADANPTVQALYNGDTLLDTFTYSVTDGTSTQNSTLQITIYGANDSPTFSTVGNTNLKSTNEDVEVAITFAEILAAANEADIDGTVKAFVVTSVTSGTLRIGASALSATPWDPDFNCVINSSQNSDSVLNAYWTPDANVNGDQNAFNVVAQDNGGLTSETPVTITIGVLPVNDSPLLTPVSITYTDTNAIDVFNPVAGTLVATDVENNTCTFGITGVTPVGNVYTQIGTYGTLTVNTTTGAYDFTPNDAAINAATGAISETFSIFASDGSLVNAIGSSTLSIFISGVNEIPTLSAFAVAGASGTEDTEFTVDFAEILSRGDEADIDGTIVAFVVTQVNSGSLKIGESAASATSWDATTNSVINSSLHGYWTPASNSNGFLNAFSVVARDDSGNESLTSIDYKITVDSVNDNPTFTLFTSVIDQVNEDTEIELTFAEIANQGNQADIDGTISSFVVKGLVGGLLQIGTSANTATPWNPNNTIIDATLNAYWTPDYNAFGTLGAFTVVARDNGGLESSTQVQVDVLVIAVNDAPMLTAIDVVGALPVVNTPNSLAGQSVIDLGSFGQLIAPVQVEGNWYYYWDRDGDGSAFNGNGSTSDSGDWTSHDVLDTLFNHNFAGVSNTTVANSDGQFGTTDTYRYATLNGVHLALPTMNGEGGVSAQIAAGTGYTLPWSGTTYTDAGLITNGTTGTYADFTAIWDAYNGTGTGNGFSGVPPAWPTSDGPW